MGRASTPANQEILTPLDGQRRRNSPARHISLAKNHAAVAFDATVARKIFVGDAVRVFLQLPGGSEIAMKLPSGTPAAHGATAGDRLRVELTGELRLFGNGGSA